MNVFQFQRGAALLAAIAIFCAASSALAQTTVETNNTSFYAANPGLPVEDFEEGVVSLPQNTGSIPGLLDASTNNGVYLTGDILPGLAVQPDGSSGVFAFGAGLVFGAGPVSIPSIAVGAQDCGEPLELHFALGVSAAGLEVVFLEGPQTIEVQPFSGATALSAAIPLTALGGDAPFIGFSNPTQSITRIRLTSLSVLHFAVDNVAFGDPVPEPSALALVGFSALVLCGAKHWRKSKSNGFLLKAVGHSRGESGSVPS